jgi:hypothetical protein
MKKVWSTFGGGAAVAAVMFTAMPGSAQTTKAPTHVTLVGCVEMEKDYRARTASGRGGLLGTGLGVGDEYVLTNVALAPGEKKGSPAISGDFGLTGKLEGDFVRQIGRRVEVIGTIKEIPAADKAKDPKALQKLSVEVWHPSKDFCPAK